VTSPVVREDAATVQAFRQRLNGANVHRGTALLRSYQFAVEYANHRKCPDVHAAVLQAKMVAEAMRRFH
jgi:hypothetical protein